MSTFPELIQVFKAFYPLLSLYLTDLINLCQAVRNKGMVAVFVHYYNNFSTIKK